jgi:hypothetical protein
MALAARAGADTDLDHGAHAGEEGNAGGGGRDVLVGARVLPALDALPLHFNIVPPLLYPMGGGTVVREQLQMGAEGRWSERSGAKVKDVICWASVVRLILLQ